MSDMEKAVEGGAEFIAAQQAKVAADLAAEEARAAGVVRQNPEPIDGSHEGDAERRLVYDTREEALAAVDAARAAGLEIVSEESGDFIQEYGERWLVHTRTP